MKSFISEETQAGRIIGFTKDGFLAVPAAVNSVDAAKILGLSATDIPILAANKLLKPLGRPSQQAPKFYLTSEIQRLGNDPDWMEKAFRVHYEHHRIKNKRKTIHLSKIENPPQLLAIAA